MTKYADAITVACRAFFGDVAWGAITGTERGDYRRAMERAIDAYERETLLANECDEPYCHKQATCGWPSLEGYRRTCGKHMPRAAV